MGQMEHVQSRLPSPTEIKEAILSYFFFQFEIQLCKIIYTSRALQMID